MLKAKLAEKEIGSEFWDIPVCPKENELFLQNTEWYISGRSALRAVIEDMGEIRNISFPSWCCDSMVKPFVDAGIEVHFYPVYWDDGLIQKISLESDALFLMDYFGYTCTSSNLGSYDGVVIRDVTHSLFSSTYSDADYYFGSLRKWCGVWTGGFAWTKDRHKLVDGKAADKEYIELRTSAMQQKADYIRGLHTDKGYLKIFNDAEELLDNVGIESAAERDVKLARKLDVNKIAECRRKNAKVLREAFPDWLIFPEMKDTDCPLFVPILVPDGKRDALRHYLIENEIYCPVHWPVSIHHRLNNQEKFIYDNEQSLVCDQRYTEEDMRRMVGIIKRFWKEV